MKVNTRTLIAIVVGIAVFFVLNRFVSIPSGIPNTSINTAYAFLSMMAIIFGPVAGAVIGFVGHMLTDMVMYETISWNWIVVSAFVGAVIGLAWNKINIGNGKFGKSEIITFNIYQIIANILGWGLIAPVLDILIKNESAAVVFTQGLVAGAANIVTIAILGTAFLAIYARTRTAPNRLD